MTSEIKTSHMVKEGGYLEYARIALEQFASSGEIDRTSLVDVVADTAVQRVLDVGCGAGQQLLQFAALKNVFCVGIDAAGEVAEVGKQTFKKFGLEGRAVFVPSKGEAIPFANSSFDVVICRVALPYMDNRIAIAEIARVLRPGGKLFLKIHAPAFYFGMIRRRLHLMSARQIAYPLICLAGGSINSLLNIHPKGGLWHGKEVFLTKRGLGKLLERNNLNILIELSDSNAATPSFLIERRGQE